MIRASWTLAAVLAAAMAMPSNAQPAQAPGGGGADPTTANDLTPTLSRLESASKATVAQLGSMHIDRWKVSADGKRDAQHNAESVVRNLNQAMPTLIAGARNAPDSPAASFKLYRNVDALYDVMSSLVESAGAFGSDAEYQGLGQQLKVFDESRAALANRIEARATQQEAEVARLRDNVRQLTAAAQAPPRQDQGKKLVVDNTPETAKPVQKKKKSSTGTAPTAKTPASNPPSGSPPPGH